MHYADGLRPGLSHGASREVAVSDPEAGGAAALRSATYRSPVAPGISSAPFRAFRFGEVGLLCLPAPHIGKGPFVGEAERSVAQAAMRPLHDLMELMQRYDGIALSSVGGSGAVGDFRPPAGTVGNGGVAACHGFARRLPASGRVLLPDAGHFLPEGAPMPMPHSRPPLSMPNGSRWKPKPLPRRSIFAPTTNCFPPRWRSPMKEVRKEAHGYLIDIQLAAGDATERSALRSAANRRLTRARSLVQYMDGIVAGSTRPERNPHALIPHKENPLLCLKPCVPFPLFVMSPTFPNPVFCSRILRRFLRTPMPCAKLSDALGAAIGPHKPDLIVGIESRGFFVWCAARVCVRGGVFPPFVKSANCPTKRSHKNML